MDVLAGQTSSASQSVTVSAVPAEPPARSADLILVIDGGGVAELGGHDELLLRDGPYLLQARSYA